MTRLRFWLMRKLYKIGSRRPYWNIGRYMERYWILGGSHPTRDRRPNEELGWKRGWIDSLIGRFVAVRLHIFNRGDESPHLHDHPWWNVSIVLNGEYVEWIPYNKAETYE